jgi:hypothetical protein
MLLITLYPLLNRQVSKKILNVVYHFQNGKKTLSRPAIFIRKPVIYDYNTRNLINVLAKNRYILIFKKKYILGAIRLVPSLYFLKKESRNINRFWRYKFCVMNFRIRNEIKLRA